MISSKRTTDYKNNIFIPPGMIIMWAGGVKSYSAQTSARSAPEGWLFCDGANVSRTTYSALYSAIGTMYGSGDGSTTFTLPGQSAVTGSATHVAGNVYMGAFPVANPNVGRIVPISCGAAGGYNFLAANSVTNVATGHGHGDALSFSNYTYDAGYHGANDATCSTDGQGYDHGGNAAMNAGGGGTNWNAGSTRQSAPSHGHNVGRNYSAHYSGGHNVGSTMNSENHSHTGGNWNLGTVNSDVNTWDPQYIHLWYLIKC